MRVGDPQAAATLPSFRAAGATSRLLPLRQGIPRLIQTAAVGAMATPGRRLLVPETRISPPSPRFLTLLPSLSSSRSHGKFRGGRASPVSLPGRWRRGSGAAHPQLPTAAGHLVPRRTQDSPQQPHVSIAAPRKVLSSSSSALCSGVRFSICSLCRHLSPLFVLLLLLILSPLPVFI